jgi:hypothetical protein
MDETFYVIIIKFHRIKFIDYFSSLIYDYCTNSHLQPTRSPANTLIQGNHNGPNHQHVANILGEELYLNIKNYLTNYLEKICQV